MTETNTPPPEGSETDPADLDGYKSLTAKLREEIKQIKSDRTPQDEKDAKAIVTLRRQLAEIQPKAAQFDKLAEASKSELERATEKANQAEQRAIAAERAAMVNQVALEKGLTPTLAKRLQGDTLEALQADADELKPFMPTTEPQSRAPRPDSSQGSGGNRTASADPAQAFAHFMKQQTG